jgi:DNA invertase Pin-like site-specific DNA recombinase
MPRPMKVPHNKNLCVAYIRCSTEDQTNSVEVQRAAICEWAEKKGVRVVAVHEDVGVGGATPVEKSPALLAALASLKEHKAGLLVAMKRCRLARDPLRMAMLENFAKRAGADVLTCDGVGESSNDAANNLYKGLLDCFSAYERAVISQRTKDALQNKKQRRERTGNVPWGYQLKDDGKTLVVSEEETKIIRLVKQLKSDGLNLRQVSERLNSENLTLRGKPWYPVKVHMILKRAA